MKEQGESEFRPPRIRANVALSRVGQSLALVGAFAILTGGLSDQPMILTLGLALAVLLVVDLAIAAATVSSFRRRSCSLSLDRVAEDTVLVPDVDYGIGLRIHPAQPPLRPIVAARLIVSPRILDAAEFSPLVPERRGYSGAFGLRFARVGFATVFGVRLRATAALGLATADFYLPVRRTFLVEPDLSVEQPALRSKLPTRARGSGVIRSRSAGGRGVTRELRDYRGSDSIRDVSWKHYARFDRLLVRERERERDIRTWLVLDACAIASAAVSDAASNAVSSVFLQAIERAARRGENVRIVAVWPGDEGPVSVRELGQTLPATALRNAESIRSSILAEAAQPREIDTRTLLMTLVQRLYSYERLDFRRSEYRDLSMSATHKEGVRAIDTKLLLTWLRAEISGSRSTMPPWVNTEKDLVGWASLIWEATHAGVRRSPMGVEGLIPVLDEAAGARTQPDRIEFYTSPFERVPASELEERVFAEDMRNVTIDVMICRGTNATAHELSGVESLAHRMVERVDQGGVERLNEMGINAHLR